MATFAAPPPSAFGGASLRRRTAVSARPAARRHGRQHAVVAAAAPREERRAAEIQRIARQLAELKAQLAAQASADAAAAQPPAAAPWPAEAPRPGAAAVPGRGAEGGGVLERLGKHGERSHFCGMSTLDGADYAPRVLAVAGRVPGAAAADVRAAPAVAGGKREMGVIAWARAPEGWAGELAAIDCPTDALGMAPDLVGLRVDIQHLAPGLEASDGDGLAIVDRGAAAREFDSLKFYAWDVAGEVHIGWLQGKPTAGEATCLGRVVCVILEEDKARARARSCWKEEDELY